MTRTLCLFVLSLGLGHPVWAQTETADFVFSSDLAEDGFVPFATSGTGNAIYGMMRDTDMYLCFIADTAEAAAERQAALVAEINGENPDREVPRIPVVCVATQ